MRSICFYIFFYFLAVVGLISSCRRKALNKDELLAFVSHNKQLNQSTEVNGIKIRLMYYPYELLVLQELRAKKNDTTGISEIIRKYKSQYYFQLFFSKNDKEVIRELGSFQNYSKMLRVFSFEMPRYISGSTETKDTIQLKDCAFEQDYGMASANALMLVFDKNDLSGKTALNVNVAEFGLGTGALNFEVQKTAMDRIPMLDLSSIESQSFQK